MPGCSALEDNICGYTGVSSDTLSAPFFFAADAVDRHCHPVSSCSGQRACSSMQWDAAGRFVVTA